MAGFLRGTVVEVRGALGKKIQARIEFRIERGEPLGQYSLYRLDGGGRIVRCACDFLRIVSEPTEPMCAGCGYPKVAHGRNIYACGSFKAPGSPL